ncbi:MAG TPA: 16S rRNA (cytosine(967)-C(5))-methyltransferase RsmB [Vicinamibacterales bacterium]|nr:16S rRNA (cytosine(967)-C(5))-methyltransferase RsmB [Vicinamibacterales bacterium]
MIGPARLAAFEVLRAVASGRTDLGSALARQRTRLRDERDRALAGEIATGTLRWQGAFDHLIAAFANRPLHKLDPEVVDILRLTIFQILHLDRIPASAAVKDAVDLAGKAGKRSASGLVNALLRRVTRERDKLPLPAAPADPSDRAAALAYLSVTLSHPAWLVRRWLDRYGFASTEAWARFNNSPAPLTLRANTLKITRDELAGRLGALGIECDPAAHALDGLLVRRGNPVSTPLHEEGLFVIQDEASQLVGSFAGAAGGERVLDVCASPGGKTIAMAAAMNGRGSIVAGDVRGRRIDLLRRTVARSGAANVFIVQADAAGPLPFGPVFDRVLLDAPCSGLGTVRRDPDIKWRRREEDLPVLAAAQTAMLEQSARVLAGTATLVYATCSSEPEENDQVVAGFLARHAEFTMPGRPFRTLPFRDGLEAFFAAMLVKTKDLR